MFLGAFDPLRFESLILFRLSLLFFQILFITSIFSVLRSIIKSSISHIKIVIFTLAFYTIFINSIPDVLEFLYWFPSVTAYQLGISLFLFFIANYFFNKTGKIPNSIYLLLNSILSLVIVGLIELMVLPMIIVIGLIIVSKHLKYENYKKEIVIAFFIIAASLITVLAPGNFERMSNLPFIERIILGAGLSFKSSIFIVGYFFQNTSFILSVILFVHLGNYIIQENTTILKFPNIHPLKLMLILLIIIPLIIFPASAALRYIPPGRVFNFVGFYVFLIFYISLLITINRYRNSINFKMNKLYKTILIVFMILSMFSGVFVIDKYKFSTGAKDSIYLNGNILNAYYTLFIEAKAFSKEMNRKQNVFIEAKREKKRTIIVQTLNPHPKMLLLVDWNDKQFLNSWVTSWEAKYYNVDSIYIEPKNAIAP